MDAARGQPAIVQRGQVIGQHGFGLVEEIVVATHSSLSADAQRHRVAQPPRPAQPVVEAHHAVEFGQASRQGLRRLVVPVPHRHDDRGHRDDLALGHRRVGRRLRHRLGGHLGRAIGKALHPEGARQHHAHRDAQLHGRRVVDQRDRAPGLAEDAMRVLAGLRVPAEELQVLRLDPSRHQPGDGIVTRLRQRRQPADPGRAVAEIAAPDAPRPHALERGVALHEVAGVGQRRQGAFQRGREDARARNVHRDEVGHERVQLLLRHAHRDLVRAIRPRLAVRDQRLHRLPDANDEFPDQQHLDAQREAADGDVDAQPDVAARRERPVERAADVVDQRRMLRHPLRTLHEVPAALGLRERG